MRCMSDRGTEHNDEEENHTVRIQLIFTESIEISNSPWRTGTGWCGGKCCGLCFCHRWPGSVARSGIAGSVEVRWVAGRGQTPWAEGRPGTGHPRGKTAWGERERWMESRKSLRNHSPLQQWQQRCLMNKSSAFIQHFKWSYLLYNNFGDVWLPNAFI